MFFVLNDMQSLCAPALKVLFISITMPESSDLCHYALEPWLEVHQNVDKGIEESQIR